MAAKRASTTSPNTSNSATIGVPATTSAQTSSSSSIGNTSAQTSPFQNTGKTFEEESSFELNESPKKYRKLAGVYEQGKRISQNLDIPQTIDEEAGEEVDMDSHTETTETIKTHRQAVEKALRGMEELEGICTNKDGLLLDDDHFSLSMYEDTDIIERGWELMIEQIDWIIPKVKDGKPSSIDEFIQLKNTVVQMLNSQFTYVSLVQQKIDDICSRIEKCQVSIAANCEP